KIECRGVPDNGDKGAFRFVAGKEKESVFNNRPADPRAVGIFMEGCHRHSNPRPFADQVFVAAQGISRSVKVIVAATRDGIDGGASEIALAHIERRDVNAKL